MWEQEWIALWPSSSSCCKGQPLFWMILLIGRFTEHFRHRKWLESKELSLYIIEVNVEHNPIHSSWRSRQISTSMATYSRWSGNCQRFSLLLMSLFMFHPIESNTVLSSKSNFWRNGVSWGFAAVSTSDHETWWVCVAHISDVRQVCRWATCPENAETSQNISRSSMIISWFSPRSKFR